MENPGSGLSRIRKLYRNSNRKPAFSIAETTISAFLPVPFDARILDEEEQIVYSLIHMIPNL